MVQSTKPLNGVNVLVTRPKHQAEILCRLIEDQGGKAIRFPAIEITGTHEGKKLSLLSDQLDTYDIAIFISANAVNFGAKPILSEREWPKSLKIAAVGKSSAKALDSLGLIADIFPIEQFNSEALLSLKEMLSVAGKRVIIFRGGAGRELLADTLTSRGATVNYANCYERSIPEANVAPLIEHWKRGDLNVIVTTSNEGLQNLYNMVGERGKSWLLRSTMVVVSKRAVDLAAKLGFKSKPIVSAQASDEAILNSLIAWKAMQNT